MSQLTQTIERIAAPDEEVFALTQRLLDAKTKPRRSLGRLESLACQLASIWGTGEPDSINPVVVVAAADHGVAREGVSAYPQQVTAEMVRNFAAGGAAINVLARAAGAQLVVVDAGVLVPIDDRQVRAMRFGAGTANMALGAAMSRQQALSAIECGIGLARGLRGDGFNLIALGDMGIGNTTAASALCAALLPADPELVCGRGTGVDDRGLAAKIAVVRRALTVNAPDRSDPVGLLSAVGGFEIAVLVGVSLGAAAARTPVLLDGFITAAAGLVAGCLAPAATLSMLAAHRSPEPGHTLVLSRLGLEPLLDLGLRLGEGSGAAIALPLLRAAVSILLDMATFEQAGVTDAGR
jgi:nicotinate-nucleotide--dimethylbenzimidazole phosphoribosyltransferase